MIINKITIDKIVKATELVCPMLKQNLISQAFIVGSVAKGNVKEDSNIDIYLINPTLNDFHPVDSFDLYPSYGIDPINYKEKSNKDIELYFRLKKIPKILSDIINYLYYELKVRYKIDEGHPYWLYKDEFFCFMYNYESESIKKAGEYIEITEELCNQINELE